MTMQQAPGIIPDIELHHRLRIAREQTGLDGQDFARDLGISRNALYALESGKSKPRELTVRAWAMRTGVSLQWLKTGDAPSGGPDGASSLPELDSNQQPAGIKPAVSIDSAPSLRRWAA